MTGPAQDAGVWASAVRAAVAGRFDEVDRLCRPQLMTVARRIAPRWAEECVQAGMLKIWRRIGTVDLSREVTIRHYLITIGTRAMRDEHRRALASRETPSEHADAVAASPAEGPDLRGTFTSRCLRSMRTHGAVGPAIRAVSRMTRKTANEVERRIREEIERCAPLIGIDIPAYVEDEELIRMLRERPQATVSGMAKTQTTERPTLDVVRVPIAELRCDPENARLHPEKNLDAIRGSLTRFGQQKPIVIGRDGTVVAGNGTLEAAKALGWTHIDAVRTSLSGAQAKAYAVADNRTTDLSTFDDAALAALLNAIRVDDESLLEACGFNDNQLAGIVELARTAGLTDEDDIPLPPDEPVTKPGDLWILGNHRLYCGDSGSPKDLDRLLGGQRIHLVNTDPPYNVKVEPRSNNAIAAGNSSFSRRDDKQCEQSGSSRGKKDRERKHHQAMDLAMHPEKGKGTTKQMRAKDRPLANDFMTDEAFDACLDAWFGNMARALLPGHGFYIWGGYANCANYPPFLKKHRLYFSQAIIWIKQHPVLTRKDFMGNHEWCFYGWLEGAAHRYFGPHNASDTWEVKKVNPQNMVHLTEKPVELATMAIGYSSKPGENVLDLFGGSGSTLIGCEQTDRHAFLMELDMPYCDVIVQRWEEFTGKKAVLER